MVRTTFFSVMPSVLCASAIVGAGFALALTGCAGTGEHASSQLPVADGSAPPKSSSGKLDGGVKPFVLASIVNCRNAATKAEADLPVIELHRVVIQESSIGGTSRTFASIDFEFTSLEPVDLEVTRACFSRMAQELAVMHEGQLHRILTANGVSESLSSVPDWTFVPSQKLIVVRYASPAWSVRSDLRSSISGSVHFLPTSAPLYDEMRFPAAIEGATMSLVP